MFQFTEYFILKYPDGCFVGVDPGSGGYPFRAFSPDTVRFWTRKSATEYMKVCSKEGFTLHQIVDFSMKKIEII